MQQLVKRSVLIVVVTQDTPVTEVFKTVIFSKETQADKASDSIYQESVKIYKIQSVVKSQEQWDKKKSPTLKVWQRPLLDESHVRLYHETGRSVEPVVDVYSAGSKAQDKRPKILFLNPKPNSPGVYIFLGEEGIGAVSKIKNYVNS